MRSIRRQQVCTYIVAVIGKPTSDVFATMGAQAVTGQQRLTAEHVERKIAVMIVVAVELAPLLVAMQLDVRGVDIEHQPARGTLIARR